MKTRKVTMALFLTSIMTIGFNAIPVSASNGNIVVNWSFEEPVVTHMENWRIYPSILGWKVEWMPTVPSSWNSYTRPGPQIELHRLANGWKTLYGSQWTELDSDWGGPDNPFGPEPASVAIHQNLATVPGGVYVLSFAYSPRPNVASNHLIVKWDGMVIADISASGASNVQWTTYTVNPLTATSATTQLRFEEAGTADSLGMFLDGVCVTLLRLTVDIDIKPGSWPNSINPWRMGTLPVATFGSDTFDVYTVNPETIRIGSVPVAERGPRKAPKLAVSYEDVNNDGRTDLVAFFRIRELAGAGELNAMTTSLTLTATLYDGTPISGSDSVRIAPPWSP